MRLTTVALLAAGGVALYAIASSVAPKSRRFVGDAASVGDNVYVDPTSLTGLFSVPAGATSIVMGVSAASDDYLTGPVIGVATPAGDLPIDTVGPFTVPRAAVVRVLKGSAAG